jgi:hypothetical protein
MDHRVLRKPLPRAKLSARSDCILRCSRVSVRRAQKLISFAAISNERIRQVVCRKSCACCADSCVQVSRSPDPLRGRASATNSRGLAKATSRMDRARRRVSHMRFLRGAPEAAPRNLCPVGTGRNSFTARALSLLPSSLMPVRSKTRRGELGPLLCLPRRSVA